MEGHRLHSMCPARRVPRSFLATTGFTMSCNSLPRARLREGGRLALIYFVDVPWRFLRGFRKVVSARGGPELIPMTLDRVTVRPIRTAAETAVDAWIGGIVLGEQPFQNLGPSAWMSANIDLCQGDGLSSCQAHRRHDRATMPASPRSPSPERGVASCSEEGLLRRPPRKPRVFKRRDLLSSKLHACETSEAHSAASNAQAEHALEAG